MNSMEYKQISNIYNKMNESWHIPRASLAGSSTSSSSNSSHKSYSNPSTVNKYPSRGHSNLAFVNNEKLMTTTTTDRHMRIHQNFDNNPIAEKHKKSKNEGITTSNNGKNVGSGGSSSSGDGGGGNGNIKRGSRSSQGSTDSNNSSHSASSGSLLLTAANLERFAAIHKKQDKLNGIKDNYQNYNANIIRSQQSQENHENNNNSSNITTTAAIKKSNNANDAIIEIDPNLHFVKTKDVDAVSIASSTHFTMVNGVGGPPRKTKEGLCSRGHQVTVLIVSMSFFFLIGISTMVYLLEMRAREMPMN